MQIHKSKHSAIEHHDKHGICQITITNQIDEDATLKRELTILASHVQKNNIKKVLIHNGDLKHPVSSEIQHWAHVSLELPLLNAGVDKIAIVYPKDKKMFALIHNNDTARKRYFASDKKALSWLKG